MLPKVDRNRYFHKRKAEWAKNTIETPVLVKWGAFGSRPDRLTVGVKHRSLPQRTASSVAPRFLDRGLGCPRRQKASHHASPRAAEPPPRLNPSPSCRVQLGEATPGRKGGGEPRSIRSARCGVGGGPPPRLRPRPRPRIPSLRHRTLAISPSPSPSPSLLLPWPTLLLLPHTAAFEVYLATPLPQRRQIPGCRDCVQVPTLVAIGRGREVLRYREVSA